MREAGDFLVMVGYKLFSSEVIILKGLVCCIIDASLMGPVTGVDYLRIVSSDMPRSELLTCFGFKGLAESLLCISGSVPVRRGYVL